MMIGFSLKSCGGAFTWAIVGVTFAHEVPQELSDFLVLISKAKLSPLRALALNFMCGCSCIVGALISYGSDVSGNFQGLVMTLGGGVYLYIATTELGPEIVKAGTLQQYVLRVFCFALGATAIGLVLLGHEHCATASSGAADPHAGHAHGAADPHAGHAH
jgi:zinc transporter ZupT